MDDKSKVVQVKVGAKIRQRRLAKMYSQKDVADLTGLSVNTISAIENGANFTAHNFYLLFNALEIHPRDLYDIDVELEPKYVLPPKSQTRIEISSNLENLVVRSDFFEEPKRVAEVLHELELDPSLSKNFSVYLSAYCRKGKLVVLQDGKVNRYQKKKPRGS